jgi:hypothetical protein
MIRAGKAFARHKLAGERPEATLHAVADDSAADLLGDSEADTHLRIAILAVADEQDETGRARPQPAIRGEKVRSLLDRG